MATGTAPRRCLRVDSASQQETQQSEEEEAPAPSSRRRVVLGLLAAASASAGCAALAPVAARVRWAPGGGGLRWRGPPGTAPGAASLRAVAAAGRLEALSLQELEEPQPGETTPSPLSHWWTNLPEDHQGPTTAPAQEPEKPDWFNQLVPKANLQDGNRCVDDEEEFDNLCYKKCSTLTFGLYPIRTSAWTCCKARPCTILNMQHQGMLCSGFDVSGDLMGRGACPHAPGGCLTNEELYMGMCYKKCSELAPDFPFRTAAGTCCKSSGLLCLSPGQSVTGPEYSVGGGADGGDPDTAQPHKPLLSLTENVPH